MDPATAVVFKNVGEKFRRYHLRESSLKDRALNILLRKRAPSDEFWALKGINFTVRKGETVGIIGENGSGKTTILNLITGILRPDAGTVSVNGMVSAMLEIGIGFHQELSGRENIYIYGAILGLSKKKIDSKFDEIVAFSGLEDFIDAPLKTYSAGMYVRLGFSVAINVEPDILLLDEALSVGDENFQRRCIDKIEEFKKRGKTIIMVSHDMYLIGALCDRVIVFRKGAIEADADAARGIEIYEEMMKRKRGGAMLERGRLKVTFDNGRISLLWNGRMISKGLGCYTSLLSGDTWYDSAFDGWGCLYLGSTKMVAMGTWKNLPIAQVWQIEMKDDNTINWTVDMQIKEKVHLRNKQINVMVTDGYMNWRASGSHHGSLPEDFSPRGREWQTIWQQDAVTPDPLSILCAGDGSGALPSVSFHCSYDRSAYIAKVINSDSSFRARVLQYVRADSDNDFEFAPDQYRYFEGRISINAD
ncbi:MAG: ABC transporter ATP-binding protein [Candidatus Omnitrophota bacterium]